MSFPANAIGLGSAALAGAAYQRNDWIMFFAFAVVAIIFGLIFS